MRAANDFIDQLRHNQLLGTIDTIQTDLYGSLGQTGKGHGTGSAVILGLLGQTPEGVDPEQVPAMLAEVEQTEQLKLDGLYPIRFPRQGAIVFHRRKTLPQHANALRLVACRDGREVLSQLYFSIGGGFIVREEDFDRARENALARQESQPPYPFHTAAQLLQLCREHGLSISALMLANECLLRDEQAVRDGLGKLWQTMQACVERGCRKEGILPGGLGVRRRAPALYRRLLTESATNTDPLNALDWVNLFALAVNEENAAGGRVVTAPTNGAAGIIPAVLCYYDRFIRPVDEETCTRYLLTAGAIGILYKTNASISGAEVGCQGEVGVACSMAAGALTEILGGTPENVENAAEIGMEHNLGLTCDPIGGLVQVPCIERNAMGAIKAINAARLALRGTGEHKVSLDKVIHTMFETGKDMKTKYKETSRGGLAVNIIEC